MKTDVLPTDEDLFREFCADDFVSLSPEQVRGLIRAEVRAFETRIDAKIDGVRTDVIKEVRKLGRKLAMGHKNLATLAGEDD